MEVSKNNRPDALPPAAIPAVHLSTRSLEIGKPNLPGEQKAAGFFQTVPKTLG